MITCYLKYEIYPSKIVEFEEYAAMWIELVNDFGGFHHGYFLPHEGANNIAIALFTFSSLASYESYRKDSKSNKDCLLAYEFARKNNCIVKYERSFLRPIM